MAHTVYAPRPAAIAAVLARSAQWTSARRKCDGKPFFYVPGSTPGAVYMTAADGCTCPAAHRYSGPCKHQLAVAEFNARRAPKSDAAYLEQLKAEQAHHGKLMRLTGWEPGELMSDPVYAERAGHIARLEARAIVAA